MNLYEDTHGDGCGCPADQTAGRVRRPRMEETPEQGIDPYDDPTGTQEMVQRAWDEFTESEHRRQVNENGGEGE